MSNPNDKPAPQPRAGEPIRLSEVRFGDGVTGAANLGPPFTQNGSTHMLKTQKQGNDEIRLVFEPWLRRFRASYYRGDKLDSEVFIPEARVTSYREER